jgi:SsrA-binding protein
MADIVTNSKARRDYHILETVEAGLVLRGTEVKSLRAGCGQIADAFVQIEGGEAYLQNAHIEEYAQGNRFNHAPRAPRKLLLHKSELRRLLAASQVKGNALIPLALYWKNRRVKVAVAVGAGKQQYDKREALRRRESERELRRVALHRVAPPARS